MTFVLAILVFIAVFGVILTSLVVIHVRRWLGSPPADDSAEDPARMEAERREAEIVIRRLERETAEERLRAERARRQALETQEAIEKMRLRWFTSNGGPEGSVRGSRRPPGGGR